MVLTGVFIAIGITFPMVFHLFEGAGRKLLPMQFPILISGYFLCPPYAVMVGILTPVLSSLITGMPPIFPNLPCLAIEFGAYALFLSILPFKNKYLKLLTSLVLGKACLFAFALLNSAFWGFAASQLSNGIIGMVWQIILVPLVVKGCERGVYYAKHYRASKV